MIILVSYFLYATIYSSSTHTSTGFIVKNSESNEWGFETRRKPLTPKRIFIIENLPTEFQISGARIKATYVISDVIGTGEWDTIIRVLNEQIKFAE